MADAINWNNIPQVDWAQLLSNSQQPATGQSSQQRPGLAQFLLQMLQKANSKPQSLDQVATDNAVRQQASGPPTPSGDNTNSIPQQASGAPTDDYWGMYQYLRNAYPGMFGVQQ